MRLRTLFSAIIIVILCTFFSLVHRDWNPPECGGLQGMKRRITFPPFSIFFSSTFLISLHPFFEIAFAEIYYRLGDALHFELICIN